MFLTHTRNSRQRRAAFPFIPFQPNGGVRRGAACYALRRKAHNESM